MENPSNCRLTLEPRGRIFSLTRLHAEDLRNAGTLSRNHRPADDASAGKIHGSGKKAAVLETPPNEKRGLTQPYPSGLRGRPLVRTHRQTTEKGGANGATPPFFAVFPRVQAEKSTGNLRVAQKCPRRKGRRAPVSPPPPCHCAGRLRGRARASRNERRCTPKLLGDYRQHSAG